jgi:hypothetical protein
METKFAQYVTEAEATGKIADKVVKATEEFVAKVEALTKESEGVYRPAGDEATSYRDKYTAIRDQLVLVQKACERLIDVSADADRVIDTAATQQS